MIRKILSSILLLCALPAAWGQDSFRAAVAVEDGFIAVGERLARLDAAGNIVRTFPLQAPLTALALWNDTLAALDTTGSAFLTISPSGELLSREETPAKGRLCALAADGAVLWAVTDAGEILHTRDGRQWTVLDFNALYKGFYPEMAFCAVAAGGGSVMVSGVGKNNTPAAFVSAGGTVWSERSLDYSEGGALRMLEAVPVSLSYDALRDRFYLLCTEGVQLTLPSCSHCNSLSRYPVAALYARVPLGFDTLLLGSDGWRLLEKP